MPDWNPNWEDVRWDHRAATDAIGALRQMAGDLEDGSGTRARAATEATTDWQGQHRQTFDERLRLMLGAMALNAASCREAAEQIGKADASARAEQARREREREEWEREDAKERARGRS